MVGVVVRTGHAPRCVFRLPRMDETCRRVGVRRMTRPDAVSLVSCALHAEATTSRAPARPTTRTPTPVERWRRPLHVLYVIDSLAPPDSERSLAAMVPRFTAAALTLDVAYLRERPCLHDEL